MSAISLPFASDVARRRAPDPGELSQGIPCGPLDEKMFNWLFWYSTGQIGNFIINSGASPDDADLDQLSAFLRLQRPNYVQTVGGTANALTAALDPVPATNAELEGMELRLKIAADNTGSVTLNVGPGAMPVTSLRGDALTAGALISGSIVTLVCKGASWALSGLAYSEVPLSLAGDLTVYVRSDGNDNNTGLSNTAGAAFATLQGAVDAVRRRYNTAGYQVTVQIGLAGTYGPVQFEQTGATRFRLRGDPANFTSYKINNSSGSPVSATGAAQLYLEGVELTGTGPLSASSGASIVYDNVQFSQSSPTGHIYATYGGTIVCSTTYAIGGFGASNHLVAGANGSIIISGATVNIVSNQAYSTFAVANNGFLGADAAAFYNSFTVTGIRYLATYGGVIYTAGGGVNFFPGNASGSVSNGGVYG